MRFKIQRIFSSDSVGIWIFEDRLINGVQKRFVAKPCQLVLEELAPQCHMPKPTLEISLAMHLTQDPLRELSIALAEYGYAISSEKVQGLYEAQSLHLDDMRKIVFKKPEGA